VTRYKLIANKDIVHLLNSVKNLDWENLFIPIVPTIRNIDFSKPVDVNVFKITIDVNKTPIPGKHMELCFIKNIAYHTTVRYDKPIDIYNGSVCYVSKNNNFVKFNGVVLNPINTSFLSYTEDGERKKINCMITAIPGIVNVCKYNAENRFFPINDTHHENHMMSNPMYNIDSRFNEFKYTYHRKWRDDIYGMCTTDDKSEIRHCEKPLTENDVSVYIGNGKCKNLSRNEYMCHKSIYTTGSNYVKISDNEYMKCRDNQIIKCEENQIYPSGTWNLNRCVEIGSATY